MALPMLMAQQLRSGLLLHVASVDAVAVLLGEGAASAGRAGTRRARGPLLPCASEGRGAWCGSTGCMAC